MAVGAMQKLFEAVARERRMQEQRREIVAELCNHPGRG